MGAAPPHERRSEGRSLVVTVLALTTSIWAIAMALAPLLQVRHMLTRRSSADVSVGYLLVLLPGFALWVGYGIASGNLVLVVPNSVAFAVAAVTTAVAVALKGRRTSADVERAQ
jgi:MtN3 and saliva related transmembrane protein